MTVLNFPVNTRPAFSLKGTVAFDHALISKYVGGLEKKSLQAAGRRYMILARNSIKRKPHSQSAPAGTPFYRHPSRKRRDGSPVGGRSSQNLTRAIQYAYDPGTSSAVVGPGFAQEFFAKHEFGGTLRMRNAQRRRRKIGDAGVIVIGRTGKQNRYASKRGGKARVPITLAKIRNEEQLARVNRLEEELYGAFELTATYPERPVMKSALKNNPNALEDELRAAYGG